MATPVELAVVELQILVREFNKRLGGLERRLGVEPEPFTPRAERVGGQAVHRPLSPLPRSERVAEFAVDPYEMAVPPRVVPPMPQPVAPLPTAEPVPVEAVPSEITAASAVGAEGSAGNETANGPPSSAEIPLHPPGPPEPPPSAAKVLKFLNSYQAEQSSTPKNGRALELTIGTWVASWIAALSIMAGILFFLKLAMDRGDLFLSPLARIGMALLAATGMLIHGYWCHWRHYRALAAGLTGAGIATLMSAVFAAHVAFSPEVISQEEAFFAIPLIAALGLLMAYQQRMPALAYLTFAGAYLSPWILDNHTDHSLVFLSYVFLVTVAALAAGSRSRAWEGLRLFGFCAGWAWMAAWTVVEHGQVHFQMGLCFICAFFALFLGDLCLKLKRALLADPATGMGATPNVAYHDSLAAIFSAINAAIAVLVCHGLYIKALVFGDWAFAAGLAVVMAVLSRVIRSDGFSISAIFQAFVLMGVAAVLAFFGSFITASFAIFAILFAVWAHVYNSEIARAWMFAFLSLAAARLFLSDVADPQLQTALATPGGMAITPWVAMAWCGAFLSLILAWLARPSTRRRADGTTEIIGATWAAIGCIVLSTVFVYGVTLQVLDRGSPFTMIALLWTFLLILFTRLRPFAEIASAIESMTSVLLMLLSAKWFLIDGTNAAGPYIQPVPTQRFIFFAMNACLLAAAIFSLRPLRAQPGTSRRFAGWWLFIMGFLLLNVELVWGIDRLVPESIPSLGTTNLIQNVALTCLWCMTALIMLAAGFWMKSTAIRYVALCLFAVTTLKILLVDMASVQSILRVVSLITLGVMLFVVSYLYHKSLLARERGIMEGGPAV